MQWPESFGRLVGILLGLNVAFAFVFSIGSSFIMSAMSGGIQSDNLTGTLMIFWALAWIAAVVDIIMGIIMLFMKQKQRAGAFFLTALWMAIIGPGVCFGGAATLGGI